MELETINKLFLELSQIATAKTAKEIKTKKLLEEAKDILTPISTGSTWMSWARPKAIDWLEKYEKENNKDR